MNLQPTNQATITFGPFEVLSARFLLYYAKVVFIAHQNTSYALCTLFRFDHPVYDSDERKNEWRPFIIAFVVSKQLDSDRTHTHTQTSTYTEHTLMSRDTDSPDGQESHIFRNTTAFQPPPSKFPHPLRHVIIIAWQSVPSFMVSSFSPELSVYHRIVCFLSCTGLHFLFRRCQQSQWSAVRSSLLHTHIGNFWYNLSFLMLT